MIPREINNVPIYVFHLFKEDLWTPPYSGEPEVHSRIIRMGIYDKHIFVPIWGYDKYGHVIPVRKQSTIPMVYPKDKWVIKELKKAIKDARIRYYWNYDGFPEKRIKDYTGPLVAHLLYRFDEPYDKQIGIATCDQLCQIKGDLNG